MLVKSIVAGLAATTMLAGAAFAQTPTATTDRTSTAPKAMATDSSPSSFQGDWRASKIVGLKVYNDQNEDIGSINDLLTDKTGNIKAAVISVGGFLGMGSHLVAIPFDKVKFDNEPVPSTGTAQNSTSKTTTTTGAATSSPTASKSNPWYPDHAVYNASKDELKAMPEFKYSNE